MSTAATMVATLRTPPVGTVEEHADWIEWRADSLGDRPPADLRRHGAKLVYSLRSGAEGGHGPQDRTERMARLQQAALSFDFIELEGARDLVPALLDHIPPQRRIISWHGHATQPGALHQSLAQLERAEARLYRLVTTSEQVVDALAPLQFLHALRRDDVIAYAESEPAAWTRPLAARAGAPIVFGEMTHAHRPAPTSLAALRRDYGLRDLHRVTEVCAIVGRAVDASPSPELHNAAYRARGAARLFLRLPAESLAGFWQGVIEPSLFEGIGLAWRGLTVASPHKKVALAVAAEASAISREAESANVLIRRGPAWQADSTDATGVLMNLRAAGISCAGRRVAVIGCGGSGRPIAAALRRSGAQVTLVNRSVARGRWAAELLGLPFRPLAELRPAEFDLLVNATPLGTGDEELPVDFSQLSRGSVVVDLVYSTSPTSFSSAARRSGHTVIDGQRILLAQVACQYKLMTGEEMPPTLAGPDESSEPPAFHLGRKVLAPSSVCEPLPT